jgi:NTE family protein
MSKDYIPDVQRALVLQGGGALGAYEAGVFHVLCNSIKKAIKNQDENVLDIIAGTSIGAINCIFGKLCNKEKKSKYNCHGKLGRFC